MHPKQKACFLPKEDRIYIGQALDHPPVCMGVGQDEPQRPAFIARLADLAHFHRVNGGTSEQRAGRGQRLVKAIPGGGLKRAVHISEPQFV